MRRVEVESPYGSPDPAIRARNRRYARACLRDCLLRGEAPYASHLLFTQPGVLSDLDEEERRLGMMAGKVWTEFAEVSVVYTDLGISSGMEWGIRAAEEAGRPVEYRELGPDWDGEHLEDRAWI